MTVKTQVFILPNHDNSEVQNIPWVPEVGSGMGNETKCNDSHDALTSEDDSEDDLNFFKEVIGSITVTIWKRGENS